MARPSRRLSRRGLIAGLAAAALAGPARAQAPGPVLVIDRRRVLRETEAGRALKQAEQAASADFDARVQAAKESLEAREAELARERGELPPEAFRAQTEAFDQAVRTTRRRTQRQAAQMQKAVRAERQRLANALAPILVDVLKDVGGDIVIDTQTILVARPSVDVTEEVIERFDAEISPRPLDLGADGPLLPEDFVRAGGDEGSGDGG